MKYCNEEFLSHKKKKLKASTAGCIHQKKYSVNWKAFLKRYSQAKQRKEWKQSASGTRNMPRNEQIHGFQSPRRQKKGKSIEKPVQWNNCWKTPWFGSMWTSRYRRPVGPLIDQNRSWSWHIIVKLWNVQDREERQTDRREKRKKDLKCCNRRALLWSWYCGTER